MQILALTTLYPYPARPRHGIFVENRLSALKERGNDIRVVAPIPYFPLSHEMFGDWSKYASPPAEEERLGIKVRHPQYLLIPKFGMAAAVGRLEKLFEKEIAKARADGFEPDILDAHYLFPDGVAATRVGKRLGIPVVLTARGSDVTLLPSYPGPRRMILESLADADHIITVAEALRRDLIEVGADPAKVTTIRNGINLNTFNPDAPRHPLMPKTKGPILLSVGHLIARKGHDLVIEALAGIPNAHLVIVGGGPEEPALRHLAHRLRLEQRITFAGEQPHDHLPSFYAYANLLMLGSDREGWPNVLLEAMASGTPCVATPAGGVREVINAPAAGLVTNSRSATELAEVARTILSDPPSRKATRSYAEGFGWEEVASDVMSVWTRAARRGSKTGWGRPTPANVKPSFLLTVDTEELFDWSGNYSEWKLPPHEALERLQETAESKDVAPLYFVTHPLIEDVEIGTRLARWQAEGRAHCGLHLHSWSTPPNGDKLTPAKTFQLHLDPDKHRLKLEALIGAFERRFGQRPIAHRAGRYGVAPWVLDQLAEKGVQIDFSPSSGFDFRVNHGPDFADFGIKARCRVSEHGPQWVLPVSGNRWLKRTTWPIPILPGNTGLMRHWKQKISTGIRLTPEGNSLSDLQTLSRQLTSSGAEILTPTLHLTSIIAGATPYANDEDGVAKLLSTLSNYIGWLTSEGYTPLTLPKLANVLDIVPFHENTAQTA